VTFALAKPHLDIGLFTNERDRQLAFWQREVGLDYDHLAKLGGGRQQHRHHCNGSIVKLNHARDPLPSLPPSGYRELLIARDGLAAPRPLADPDGNKVTLVPRGWRGVQGIAVAMLANDLAAFDAFYRGALGFTPLPDGVWRCGDTLLLPVQGAVARGDDWVAPGWRYLTVQVFDADAAYDEILARGGTVGRPPATVGTTARYGFVRDPDGNWIEISARASLTGRALG